ncbi:unnamed protein product [Ectocarpus sp. 13 AM-2016]
MLSSGAGKKMAPVATAKQATGPPLGVTSKRWSIVTRSGFSLGGESSSLPAATRAQMAHGCTAAKSSRLERVGLWILVNMVPASGDQVSVEKCRQVGNGAHS